MRLDAQVCVRFTRSMLKILDFTGWKKICVLSLSYQLWSESIHKFAICFADFVTTFNVLGWFWSALMYLHFSMDKLLTSISGFHWNLLLIPLSRISYSYTNSLTMCLYFIVVKPLRKTYFVTSTGKDDAKRSCLKFDRTR